MILSIPCPQCGKEIEYEYYADGLGIVEEHINCQYCDYHENWAYGVDLDRMDQIDNIAQNNK